VTATLDVRGDVRDTRYIGLGTFGAAGLWITDDSDGVALIDPATNRVVSHVPLTGLNNTWAAQQIVNGPPGQLWVLASDGGAGSLGSRTAVFRLDEATRTAQGLRSSSRLEFGDFLTGDGNTLWVRHNFRLRGIDAASGITTADLSDIPNCIPPAPITAGALWCGSVDPNVFRFGLTDGSVWEVRIG
jgi:hypothetical protein